LHDTYQKNFYISTNDIYGEWSDPVFVEQEGIDPSLLFDGDGEPTIKREEQMDQTVEAILTQIEEGGEGQ
jgi:hypothetical protein